MKKKLIIIGIVALFLIATGIVYQYYHNQIKKEIDAYLVQLDQGKVTSDDSIGKKLSEKMVLYQNLVTKTKEEWNREPSYMDLEGSKITFEEKKVTYQEFDKDLELLQEDQIVNLFRNDYHNQLSYVKRQYQKLKFYQNVQKLQTEIDDTKNQLNHLLEYTNYLLEHPSDIKYFDSVLYYENEEIGTMLQKFQETLKLDTKIEKGTLSYTTAHIPILMYHGVSDNVWGISSLFVSPKDFEEQMKYLSENDYTPIFMHEIEHLDPSITKPIVITFDDGNFDVYQEAFPILKKYNIKATVFVISGFGDGVYSMTHDQVKQMSTSDLISIQSHTVTHKQLATLSETEIEQELKDSKRALEELTEKSVYTIAYPVGSYDKRVIEIAKKYYKYGLLAGGGTADINQNMSYFEIERIGIYREDSFAKFKAACETARR